jgi:uncharacterized membrane protein YesL
MVRVGQLLWRSLRFSYLHLTEILLISLLWFLCSIPIVTMPASTCGVFYAIKDLSNERKAIKNFLAGFKLYFLNTLILGFITVFLLLVILSSFWYYYNVRNLYSTIFFISQVSVVSFIAFTQLYTLPLMVNYKPRYIECVKLSTLLVLSSIRYSLSVFLEVIFITTILLFSIVGLPLLYGIVCIFIEQCTVDLVERLESVK